MVEYEYGEYLSIINNHQNPFARQIYSKYADEIKGVKLTSSKGAAYSPGSNTLNFNYPKHNDLNKYDALAHEYGYFFDAAAKFKGLRFNEIRAVEYKMLLMACSLGQELSGDMVNDITIKNIQTLNSWIKWQEHQEKKHCKRFIRIWVLMQAIRQKSKRFAGNMKRHQKLGQIS
ncbi:MAG: hypothetical protein RSB80_03945 [Anaerovoracaceae bacterium]